MGSPLSWGLCSLICIVGPITQVGDIGQKQGRGCRMEGGLPTQEVYRVSPKEVRRPRL